MKKNSLMKNSFSEDFVKPVIVLLAICVVVAGLLGAVNSITEPIITVNALKKAEETRKAVLPGAESFNEVTCDLDTLGITGFYEEASGKGYVVTAAYKGYGGPVAVTVGLDSEGTVIGLSADVSGETSGVGSKAGKEDFLNRFFGLSGSASSVDTISNATYSSTAVRSGVDAALKAFQAVKGD